MPLPVFDWHVVPEPMPRPPQRDLYGHSDPVSPVKLPITVNPGATANVTTSGAVTTGSFTPLAGNLLIAIGVTNGATSGSFTDSQSLGWTIIATVPYNTSGSSLVIAVANAFAAAVATTVTFTPGGGSTAAIVSVIRVSGMPFAGAQAVRQIGTAANQAAASRPNITLRGGPPLPYNALIGAVGNLSNPAGVTQTTFWLQIVNTGNTSPLGLEAEGIVNNVSSQTITWGANSASAFGAVVVELNTPGNDSPIQVDKWYVRPEELPRPPQRFLYGYSEPIPPVQQRPVGFLVTNMAGASATNNAAITSAIVAVPPGCVAVAFGYCTGQLGGGTFTDTQSLGWTNIGTDKFNGTDSLTAAVSNTFTTAGNLSVTFTPAGGPASSGAAISVFIISGIPSAGIGAIRQWGISNQPSGNTPTPSLRGGPALPNNPMVAALANGTNPPTLAGPTGFTSAVNTGYSTPTAGLETYFVIGGQTAQAFPWGGTSASNFGDFIVELNTIATDTITLDKWLGYQEPPPRPSRHVPDALGFFTIDAVAVGAPETVTVDKWLQEPADVIRPPRHLPYQIGESGAPPILVTETILLDKWWPHAEEPPRPVKRFQEPGTLAGLGVFVVETAGLDKWYQEPADVARPPKRFQEPGALGGIGVFVIETTGVDKWYQEPADVARPVRHIPDQLGALAATGLGVFVFESVTADRWYPHPESQPRPPARFQEPGALGGVGVFTVETPQLDKWWQEPADVARPVRHVPDALGGYALGGVGVFVTETSQVDKWWVQASESPRPVRHIPDALGGTFLVGQGVFVTETTQLDKWYQEPADVIRPPKHVPYQLGDSALGGMGVFVVETSQLDKWEPHYPAWVRPGPRLPIGSFQPELIYASFVAPVIPPDRWWPHIEDPQRERNRPWLGDFETTVGVFVAETVGVDKWYVQASEQPRPPKHIPYQLGDFWLGGMGLFLVPPVFPDKWYQEPADVARPVQQVVYHLGDFKAGLSVVIETTQVDKWYVRAEESPRPPKRFQEPGALGGVGVFVTETPGLDKWYTQSTAAPPRAGRVMAGGRDMAASFVVLVGADAWASPNPAPDRRKASRIESGAAFVPVVVTAAVTPFDWQNESWAAPRPVDRIACHEGQWVFEAVAPPSGVVFRRGWGTGSRTGTRQQQNNAGEG